MKKMLFLIVSVIGLFSCRENNENVNEIGSQMLTNTRKLDLTAYNNREKLYTVLESSHQGSKLNVFSTDNENIGSEKELIEKNIEYINLQYGTNLEITQMDEYMMNNKSHISTQDLLNKGFITQKDKEIIDFFGKSVEQSGFDVAIELLKNKVINSNLSDEEFKKYNHLVNTLMIVRDYYEYKENNFTSNKGGLVTFSSNKSTSMSTGCALAIAGNSVATFGLSSCFVPGPNCAIAAIGKVISLAGIITSCP